MSKQGNQRRRLQSRRRTQEKKARQAELGSIGRFFGGADERPGNVAAMVVLISVFVAAVAGFQDGKPSMVRDTFAGLATLALAQLFADRKSVV